MSDFRLNTIYNEDCLETMKRMPDSIVDLVVTDPPYELDLAGGMNSAIMSMDKYKGDKLKAISVGLDIGYWLPEVKRVCKKFNAYIFCSNKQVSQLMAWGQENGYITNLLVWHKLNSPPFANGVWKSDLEFIVHIRERGATFQGDASVKSKLYQSNLVNDKSHPSVKPMELLAKFIKISSNKGDLIYDPFTGSGTTARVCKDLGRNWVGSEIVEEYHKVAENRLKQEALL